MKKILYLCCGIENNVMAFCLALVLRRFRPKVLGWAGKDSMTYKRRLHDALFLAIKNLANSKFRQDEAMVDVQGCDYLHSPCVNVRG